MTRRTKTTALLILCIICMLGSPIPTLAEEKSLTTRYDADSHAEGILFNVEVISDTDWIIDSFDINLTSDISATTVYVYYREGGYEGYEHDAGTWTFAGSVNVKAQGKNVVTHLPIGNIPLTAGKTYGIYMAVDSGFNRYFRYTNLETTKEYEDDNIRITTGTAQNNPQFGGILIYPRIWNGTIYYSLKSDHETNIPNTGDRAGSITILWALLALSTIATLLIFRSWFSK